MEKGAARSVCVFVFVRACTAQWLEEEGCLDKIEGGGRGLILERCKQLCDGKKNNI